jgi:serine/threonine protein kinase
MATELTRVESIFFAALDKEDAQERAAYLDSACGEDAGLRCRVERLLNAHPKLGDFLQGDAAQMAATTNVNIAERPGTQIGPYKLLQQLGEGGMGVVFLAERQHPVKQRVALKIIKQGMDTKNFIARFEAERQALALMDHPNIAKVLDAGCTEAGRPYFVMELVKGVAISTYCDESRLNTRERLDLFIQVCHAVQHAHQKGIIHRDLKPSNVLVALYDDRPVPKVIDFGVAKATNQQLTEKTLFTEVGSILGTWEYMSPEQAILNQLDVDTRTDVYSLGVVLYELLTGETPLDRQRLREVQIMETLRMIREDEPPKPSTRVSSLGKQVSETAACRRTNPDALASEFRGDLDWIVMKALAKERSRRYDSASRFADDLQRYLNNELVEARPPSVWYQMQKFWQRNKMVAASALAVFLALTTGLAMAVWGLQVQREAYCTLADNLTQLQAKNELLREAFVCQAFTAAIAGDQRTMHEAIENAVMAGENPVWHEIMAGLMADHQGDGPKAVSLLEKATEDAPDNLAAQAILASAYWNAGRIDEHEECVLRLGKLESKTRFDTLFVAHANRFWHSTKALQQISPLVEDRTSWGIAHIMLAEVKVWNAWDLGEVEQAVSAITDVQLGKAKLPSMAIVHQTELLACLAALDLAEQDDARRSAWQSRADAAAKELEVRFLQRGRHYELATYYYQRGEKEKALAALSDSDDFVQRSLREALLFGLGRFAEMQHVCAAMETSVPSEVVRRVREDGSSDQSFIRRIWNQLPLSASGERKEARDNWNALIGTRTELPFNYEYPLMLFSGRWNEQELLKRASSANSRLREFFAHVCLGHHYLYVEPDRERAKRHFERAVETGPIASEATVWAQSYLDLLKDETWPSWLR